MNTTKENLTALASENSYEARETLRKIYSANNRKEDKNLLADWKEPARPEGDFSFFSIYLKNGEILSNGAEGSDWIKVPKYMLGDFAVHFGLPAGADWKEIEKAYEADHNKAREFLAARKEEITSFFAPYEEYRHFRDYPARLRKEITGAPAYRLGEVWACLRRKCDGLRYLVRFVGDYEQHWIEGDKDWRDVANRQGNADDSGAGYGMNA